MRKRKRKTVSIRPAFPISYFLFLISDFLFPDVSDFLFGVRLVNARCAEKAAVSKSAKAADRAGTLSNEELLSN